VGAPIFAGEPMAVRTFWTALRGRAHANGGTRRPDVPAQRPESWGVYLATVAGAALAFLSLLWLGLAWLDHFDLLPPPQLSNNLCIDQKLAYLREHPVRRPTILATGSSVTWRNFDSSAVLQASGGRAVPLNGAFCGLKMNQTTYVTEYLVGRMPSVQAVMTILAPQDLTDCSNTNSRVFDIGDVDDFVFRRSSEFAFYLKYFDPLTLIKNVFILRAMRKGGLPFDEIRMDRYGDAPIDTEASRDLTYGALPPPDPVCLEALQKLAYDLAAGGRRLTVVTMPLDPTWKKQYDPDGAVMRNMTHDIRQALAGSGAVFWDANHDFAMDPDAFIDAIHIRWSAAKTFSRALIAATGLGRAPQGSATE
jgi:hypothetical protein